MIPRGTSIERYVVERMLGRGGSASVYAVRHALDGSRHALKVLHGADLGARERLLREGKVQARLDPAHTVPVTAVLVVDGSPALLMPLVEGGTLAALLDDLRLSEAEAAALFAGIVRGVSSAHAAGVAHRDLKPANILLGLRDGRVVPYVADFGLAKALDPGGSLGGDTRTGAFLGTPAYASPEQLVDASGVDARADLWSLGVIGYELLCGRRPFVGANAGALSAAQHATLDVSPLPARWVEILAGLLQVDPDRRTADIGSLAASLAPLVDDAGLAATAQVGLWVGLNAGQSRAPDDRAATTLGTHLVPAQDGTWRMVEAGDPGGGEALWGREAELVWLRAALRHAGARVTVIGAGGVGKTTLAHAIVATTPTAVYADADDATDDDALIAALGRGLGIVVGPDAEAGLVYALARRGPTLLVLDAAERSLDAARRLFDRLATSAPNVTTLVTSRIALGLQGEQVLRLGPLALPEGSDPSLLRASPAVGLFLEQARAARAGLVPDPETLALASQIVARLDGIPLAIRLAAARARALSLPELLAHLDRRLLDVLATQDTELHRHRTIRAAVAWSFDLLTPAIAGAATRLSVFRGPFTVASADAVLDPSGPWVGDVVEALVAHHLLDRTPEGRLRWLDTVRAVADERALALDVRADARARHVARMARHGADENLTITMRAAGAGAWTELLAERADVISAFDHAVERSDLPHLAPLLSAIGHLARTGGPPTLVSDRVKRLPPGCSADLQVFAAALRVELDYAGGGAGAGLDALESLLQLHGENVDPKIRFAAEKRRSLALKALGRKEQQAALIEALVSEFGPAAGPVCVADALCHRGIHRHETGALAEAEADLREALRSSRALGLDRLTGIALGNLANVLRDHGDPAGARVLAEEALAVARENQDADRVPIALSTLATLDYVAGRFNSARTHLEEAREALLRQGMLGRLAQVDGNLALTLSVLGHSTEAIAVLRRLSTSSLAPAGMQAMARAYLGRSLAAVGRPIEARAELDLALDAGRKIGSRMVQGMALQHLADLAGGTEGLAFAAEGEAVTAPLGAAPQASINLAVHAAALAANGQTEAAYARAKVAAERASQTQSPLQRLQIWLPLLGLAATVAPDHASDWLADALDAAGHLELGPASLEQLALATATRTITSLAH